MTGAALTRPYYLDMKKKLDSYTGSLTAKQVAAGINAARANASRLIEDAKLLFNAKRYPSSTALCILAIEEAGKINVLRGLALSMNAAELSSEWKEYRTHTSKNVMWIFPQLAARGARKLEDFSSIFDKNADHPYILDQLKQVAIYTDCLGKAHWSLPTVCIDEELAHTLLHTASLLCSDREVTEEEIGLWVKHVGPAWHANNALRLKALISWHDEMVKRGLLAAEELGKMKQFIVEGYK